MNKIAELKEKQIQEVAKLNLEIAVMEDIAKHTKIEPKYVSTSWKKHHVVFEVGTKEHLQEIMNSFDALPLNYYDWGSSFTRTLDELQDDLGDKTVQQQNGETIPLIEHGRKQGKCYDLTSPYCISIGNSRHTGADFKVRFKTKDYDITVNVTKNILEEHLTSGTFNDPHATDEARKWGKGAQTQHCLLLCGDLKQIHYYGNSFQYMATTEEQAETIKNILS